MLGRRGEIMLNQEQADKIKNDIQYIVLELDGEKAIKFMEGTIKYIDTIVNERCVWTFCSWDNEYIDCNDYHYSIDDAKHEVISMNYCKHCGKRIEIKGGEL